MEGKNFSAFTLVLLALLCLIMPACSSQDDVISPEKTEAPLDATGEFKFYKGDNLNWSFRVLPASDPTSSIALINSTTAQVNGTGTFYYRRINEISASVSCFFVTRIAIGGNIVGQWNQYELTLIFLSAHHGYFTGVEKKNPEDSGSEISGRFVYDSEMELEEILKEHGDDDNGNPKQEISEGNVDISAPELNVIGSTLQVKGIILSDMEFDSNGAILSFEPDGNVEKCEERVASSSNIVDLKFNIAAGYKYYVRLFAKIKGGDYVYGEEKEFTAPGEKVTQVKGEQVFWNPGIVKVKLEIPPYLVKDYGICWSEKPHPTVTDNYLPEKKYEKELNRTDIWELTDLKRTMEYYVRTYHIEGSKITYYPGEIKCQTLGLDKNINLDIQFNPTNFKKGTVGIYYGELPNVNFVVSWAGFPEGTYKADVYFFNRNNKNDYGGVRRQFFIDKSNGSESLLAEKLVFYVPISGLESSGSYIEVKISSLDDTPIATAYYKCAWNYTKFIFNPEPQSKVWVMDSNSSEGAINACMH